MVCSRILYMERRRDAESLKLLLSNGWNILSKCKCPYHIHISFKFHLTPNRHDEHAFITPEHCLYIHYRTESPVPGAHAVRGGGLQRDKEEDGKEDGGHIQKKPLTLREEHQGP